MGVKLAATYADLEEYARAEQVIEKGLAFCKAEGDAALRAKGSYLSLRGRILVKRGLLAEGEASLEEARVIQEDVLGSTHQETLTTLEQLAQAKFRRGEVGVGELVEEILSRNREHVGSDHPQTIRSLANVAMVMINARDVERAAPLVDEFERGARKVFGETVELDALALELRSELELARGNLEQARDHSRQRVDLLRKHDPRGSAELGIALYSFAKFERAVGRYKEAVEVLGEGIAMLEATDGLDSVTLFRARQLLAATLGRMGRDEESLEMLRACIEEADGLFGSPSPHAAVARHTLANSLNRLGRNEEAERWLASRSRCDSTSMGRRAGKPTRPWRLWD